MGKDPRNVEYLWATMYNFTRFPGGMLVNAAISGIEQALWDIAGKAAGLPVYMLMGGKCRNKVRCYQAANSPEEAKRLVGKYGYTALKATLGVCQFRAGSRQHPRLRDARRGHARGGRTERRLVLRRARQNLGAVPGLRAVPRF